MMRLEPWVFLTPCHALAVAPRLNTDTPSQRDRCVCSLRWETCWRHSRVTLRRQAACGTSGKCSPKDQGPSSHAPIPA
jgi:hypothetical protein